MLYNPVKANKEKDEERHAERVELYNKERIGWEDMHTTSVTRPKKAGRVSALLLGEEPVTLPLFGASAMPQSTTKRAFASVRDCICQSQPGRGPFAFQSLNIQ